MKFVSDSRGSVLMEFIVVFPVYLVLLAGTFMIGDSFVKTIQLSFEERVDAFDGVGGEGEVRRSKYYADTVVEGPWSLRSAVKVIGKYALPRIGLAGQLDYTDRTFRGVRAADDYGALIHGNKINVYSRNERDLNGAARAFAFNFYTLRRDKSGSIASSWRDNRRYASDLVCARSGRIHNWSSQVYGEEFHAEVNDETNNGTGKPTDAGGADEYFRYQSYVNWSN